MLIDAGLTMTKRILQSKVSPKSSQVQASDRSEDDAVGNSLGVRQELAKGIRSLPGLCKRVHRKKTEARKKIIGGGRNACRELERS
ncbi:hypothetical protein GW17_00020646 [Ensete ventricosum]|nr:hypothetical protein GW17_00020646 [Ensete ventricosum]